jgi:hypothetical protein
MAQKCTLPHTQVKPALLDFLLFDAAIQSRYLLLQFSRLCLEGFRVLYQLGCSCQ